MAMPSYPSRPTRPHLTLLVQEDYDEDAIRREYLAPFRGIVIAFLLCIPFWVMLGVVIGLAAS